MTIDMKRHALASAAAMGAALLAASAALAQDYTVALGAMDYGAIPSNLKVGDSITWVNRDTVIHSITARDHSFDLRLSPGQSSKMDLQKAGVIAIYCLFHPTMRGTLKVAAKP